MKYKIVISLLGIFSAILSVKYLIEVSVSEFQQLSQFGIEVFLGSTLILLGLLLRARRSFYLFNEISSISFANQVGALASGYALNLILPFRLGEVLRGAILNYFSAAGLGTTFSILIFERGADLIFLSILFFAFSIFGVIQISPESISPFILSIFSASALFLILILIFLRLPIMMKIILITSRTLNKSLARRLQNSVWQIIMNMNLLLRNSKLLRRYFTNFYFSWTLIFAGSAISLSENKEAFLSLRTRLGDTLLIVTNSIAARLNYQTYFDNSPKFFHESQGLWGSTYHNSLTQQWFSSNFLILIIGTIYLMWISFNYFSKPLRISDNSSLENLPSEEFLESFFLNEPLIIEYFKTWAGANLNVLTFYRGGSNAVTMLVKHNGELSIRKIASLKDAVKLENQAKWLAANQNTYGIVPYLDYYRHERISELKLEYVNSSCSLFDYIHSHDINQSKKMIELAWHTMSINIYMSSKLESNVISKSKVFKQKTELLSIPCIKPHETNFVAEERELSAGYECHTKSERMLNHIRTSVHDRIESLQRINNSYREWLDPNKQYILNGTTLQSLNQIIEVINSRNELAESIFNYEVSESCHGDLTVDNILIRTDSQSCNPYPILIDPSNDNHVQSPVIDAGRMVQSLFGGYEFKIRNLQTSHYEIRNSKVILNFLDFRSWYYEVLADWFAQNLLRDSLSEKEIQSTKFHAGVFFIRMLPHRIRIHEKSAINYFGTGLKLLNEFINE